MFTIENAQLVLKDKNGNVARIQNLGPDDFAKIRNAIADIGKLVDPVSHLPIKATTTTVGVVQLADDEAIAAGTTGRVVDAKQLQDAVMGVSPANCVTNVAAGSTANKIKVTKDGYTTTIEIDNVEHASFANQATHSTLADTADIAARATKADDATHAAKADDATHAAKADEATHAAKADEANSVAWDKVSGKPSSYTPSSHTHNYAGSPSAGGAASTALKLETYRQGSTTETYGANYPVFAQWEGNEVVLKCTDYVVCVDKATKDSKGQNIAGTYIKGFSVSGKTVTYTRGDGTTGTFTTQDTNTTYSAGSNLSLSGTQFNVSSAPTFNSVKVTNNSSNGILFGDYRVYVG